jgi:hypothetical protein
MKYENIGKFRRVLDTNSYIELLSPDVVRRRVTGLGTGRTPDRRRYLLEKRFLAICRCNRTWVRRKLQVG